MESFRNKLVKIINEARLNPRSSSQELYRQLSPYYDQQQLHFFNKHIDTFQGIAALEDYVQFMKNNKNVDYLSISDALCQAAQAIAEGKGRIGRSDHENPKAIYEKISAYGCVQGNIGQLIALKTHSSQEVATYFLIDDGLYSRKRRRMLLDTKYKHIGIGSSRHINHEIIVVILLAQKVVDLKQSQALRNLYQ